MFSSPRVPRIRRSSLALAVLVAALAFPLGVLATHQFSDVATSASYHDDVEALVNAGITTGCATGLYCPSSPVTRGQMAQFLNRLGSLDGTTPPSVDADKVDGLEPADIAALAGGSRSLVGKTGHLAYAWANDATAASYTPSTLYSYNSAGGAITITRSAVGKYEVAFAGLTLGAGHVQVSKYGLGSGSCHVANWGLGAINVECYTVAGAAADMRFTVMFTD